SDPIGFAQHQVEVVKAIQPDLAERLLEAGESSQQLLDAYWLSLWRYRSALTTVSRFIGGVYVERAMNGQNGATQPLTPVSAADQQRATATLQNSLFAPDAFSAFDQSATHLLAQRRGWD